ncbi:hypothetical protein GIW81_04025 [Hyphomicrobium sp. xq]|uniref:Uncharacterized protein n=1 Tax=Hyphomicrobium album TaxID=2665159 RepID=A0A6I3KLA1_9HYPH|nr:hypothetical protein [Hyphomicrobium album]MTD93501.1 hypothetical protein [Hyphomicrobium album]
MPSATYTLIRKAILAERQVTCHYNGHYRELCPHILGHTNGEEKLLAFQFGGESSKPLPRGGEWRCLLVAGMRDVETRGGPWHAGSSHRTTQRCVADIDLDINIHVRRLR